jgi:anti-sigma regulatory factor (Ser/Thr protein kinase)
MKEEHSIRIGNSMTEVASALDQAEDWLGEMNAPQKAHYFVSLAIEELATNWIKYGCQNADAHFMIFHLSLCGDRVSLQASDDGFPFNPLDVPEPSTALPPEDREIGGLGILLLRKMADHMSYEHRDRCNILTLEKNCPTSDHEQT